MSETQVENKDKITQESLQPKRIEKGEKAYKSVLDIEERLQKGDATNIALTGPYGSGKSSILITLKEDFPEHHYLNISLATLKPTDFKIQEKEAQNDSEDDNEGDEPKKPKAKEKLTKLNIDRLIEYSILQQLIYKEKQASLPNSRFKRIFQLPERTVRKATIAVILACLAVFILFEPTCLKVEWLCKLFGKEWMNITGDTLSILYLLWFAFETITRIIPAISNSRLNKLNLKDGEIEIVKNTSIFNKHLDEILYFFEQTEYNVVMLEDLDRFETSDIFLKLRELNLLLNESKVVGRKIFFVYAVRDDMFLDAERVKCFDYITTVIPVINRSNAKDQLKEELAKRGVTDIADIHLRELGFFLHDMRLLKNIANEFVQYRTKLEKGISSEKLLGMIVYKNYFPKDFADLHDCKGVVYQLLNLKDVFIAQRIEEIENDNKRKRELRQRHQKERQFKEEEIRRIYIDAYKDKCGDNVLQFRAGDSFYSLKDIAKNEKLFEKLIASPTLTYTYIVTYSSYNAGRTQNKSINVNFTEIEEMVNPVVSYKERIEAIRTDFNAFENQTLIDIKKEDVRSLSLSEIMNDIDYANVDEFVELDVPKLAEYLVVKGYIDENYYDYISYFYANFIDNNDWNFVLDLKLKKSQPYDYSIHNVEACLHEIPSVVYRRKEILNIDIVDYLAENKDVKINAVRLSIILRTIVENKKYDFLTVYYQKGHQQAFVFSVLFDQTKELWADFSKYDDEKQSLKVIWYKYAEKNLSCKGSQEWLSNHFKFITDHLQDINEDLWNELIIDKNYQFAELNGVSANILKAVVNTDSYTLTKQNVVELVSYLKGMNFESVSYRLVAETECDKLVDRVEENLGHCLKAVFSTPEAIKEDVETIQGILLSPQATEDEKIAYLREQQNKINLDVIEQNDMKTLALKCDVIEPSWDNVIHYMKNVSEQKTDDVLKMFIERHADELAGLKVSAESEVEQMLLRQLIKSDVLAFDTYCKIVNQFTKWKLTGASSIEERRVLLLIEKGMFPFKEENTDDLTNNYSDNAVVAYLINNKNDFLTNLDSVEYTTEVALGLLKSHLSVREKAMILPCLDKELLNKDLANAAIVVLAAQGVVLDVDFLLKVMSFSDKTNEKIIVLNYTLEKNDYAEETITSFINTLPGKYKEIAEKGKKPELPNDSKTLRLVKALDERNYISSYSESKDGIRVNTKKK